MLQYDCVFVDDGQAVGTEICSIPVVGGIANLQELRKEYSMLVVGIENNKFRAQVYEKAMKSLNRTIQILSSSRCKRRVLADVRIILWNTTLHGKTMVAPRL